MSRSELAYNNDGTVSYEDQTLDPIEYFHYTVG